MTLSDGDYPVDNSQLIVYLVLTLASIVVSLAVFLYFMECSDISKNDREEFNSKVYNFIIEEDGKPERNEPNTDRSKMTEKLL
jgi:hypothetical protein